MDETLRVDLSWELQQLQALLSEACGALTAPSVLYKPKLRRDEGGNWTAEIQDGLVVGRGPSPAKAMWDFDNQWQTDTTKDVN